MKKFVSLLLVIVLALSLSGSALAEENGEITPAEAFWNNLILAFQTVMADVTSYDYNYLTRLNIFRLIGETEYNKEETDLTEAEQWEITNNFVNFLASATPIKDPAAERIYLWGEGNVPTVTEVEGDPYTPYMLYYPASEAVEKKGAIVFCSGGGYVVICNIEEAMSSSVAMSALGYDCFIVNYRIKPYTVDEGAWDLARAIRIVRSKADEYGYDPDQITSGGFSAGGMTVMYTADKFYGDFLPDADGYIPDEIDQISADIDAVLGIYSFLTDGGFGLGTEVTNPDYPPTFMAVGTDDFMFQMVLSCYELLISSGVTAELHTFIDAPHGFGAGTMSTGVLHKNAALWPELADEFLQIVYNTTDVE